MTGGVAGALAGARWGIGAIPSRWSSPLHGPVNTPEDSEYDIAGLRALALQIAGLPPDENIEDPGVAGERPPPRRSSWALRRRSQRRRSFA